MVELELPQDVAAPAQARAKVDELGLDPESGHALKLVLTELVTNAVLHGQGPVSLRLAERSGRIEGEVADAGRGFRSPPPRNGDAEGGRGLFLVDALCERWQVDPDRSRVRFEFAPAA
jgi:anti-sigma regulatory factor (Ser/Thr protein kinase)